MLKLNNIDFGLASYGAGNGTAIFLVDIQGTNDEAEKLTYEKFKSAIEEKYSKQYAEFLSASQKYHMYFKGGSIEKKEHNQEFSTFIEEMSKHAIEHQKTVHVSQLRPPFMVWVGTPRILSGPRNELGSFYENFNFVIGLCDEKTPDLPLRELCNHNFHCVVVRAKKTEDVTFLNGKQLRPNELSILDDNDEPSEELQILSIRNGFRYFRPSLKGQYILG